jgi:glutathione S-transferase
MSSLLRDRSEDGGRSPLSSTLARELKGEKMIPVYGFSRVKDPVVGETRDLRAPWALEETGLPYRVHGLDYVEGDTKTGDNRRISPFSQVPVIDDDGFVIAESGAIVLYIAEKAGVLIPADLQGRSRVTQWCFTALNALEPTLLQIQIIEGGGEKATGVQRRPELAERREKNLRCWSSSCRVALTLQVKILRSLTS